MKRNAQQIKAAVWAAALLVAVRASLAAPAGPEVIASVTRSQITLADTVSYSVQVTGLSGRQVPIEPPDFVSAGFQVVDGPMLRSEFNLAMGVQSSSLIYTWTLRPTREGTLLIPPARVGIPGGRPLASNSVQVMVAKSPPPLPALGTSFQGEDIPPPRTGNANVDKQLAGRLFLRAIADKTTAYPGEQITLRYELYQDAALPVVNYRIDPPDYRDFSVAVIYQPPSGRLEFRDQPVGKVAFRVATLQTVALFANKSGTVAVPPYQLIVAIQVDRGRTRGLSLFDDPFFDDPFGGSLLGPPTIGAQLATRAITVNILPLPVENRPANFGGTVGDYKLSASFDQTEVKQFDSVDLKVRIAGTGKLDSVSPPELPRVSGLQLFNKQSNSAPAESNGQLGGTRTFDFILKTTQAGELAFPPIRYALFNPRLKKYEELQTQPLALRVLPAPQTEQPLVQAFAPPPSGAGGETQSPVVELNRNIDYIRITGFLSHGLTVAPLYENSAFLLFQAAPLALVLISLAVRRRREKREGDVAWARRRSARSVASKRLREAGRRLGAEQGDRFFEELDRALRQFVADQLNESAAGLTADRVVQALSGRGIAQDDVDQMGALLEACESARYAVSRPATAEMRQTFERASELIDRLAKTLKN